MRVCGDWRGPRAQEERGAPQAPLVIITSVDGRVTSSVDLIIVKVDVRNVAGKWRTRGWTGRSPSGTGFDGADPYEKRGV